MEIIRGEDGRLIKVPEKKPLFRIKISPRLVVAGLFALLIWTLVGIATWKLFAPWKSIFGPSAPSLRTEAEYQSAQEGLRFHAPDGWSQTFVSGKYPSGSTNQERKLVGYRKGIAGQSASLEVTYVDLPASTDLGNYLANATPGVTWNLTGAATPLSIAGAEAKRFIFSTGAAPNQTTKEVVALRRGDRVYFFTGTFPSADTDSQQKIRRAVESAAW